MNSHKVLMFGWEYPPFNSGGLGVACLGLTQALIRKGTRIAFVLPRHFEVSSSSMEFLFAGNDRISIHEIDSLLRAYSTSESYSRERHLYRNALYGRSLIDEVLRYGLAARDIARSTPHSIIHAHDWLSFPAGMEAKKISGRPMVAHVHATEFDRTGGGGVNREVYEIEREGMHKSDIVVAVSNLTKRIVVDKYGIPHEKVKVVYNGINPHEYSHHINSATTLKLKDYGYKVVMFSGRITLQKGPDYFLKAAQKVLHFYDKVIFVVAGSGDMEGQIIKQAVQMGISDRVFFVGYLRGNELNSMYRAADLLVMPSVSEPFGIAALEGIANNTPILISKQSGVSEVVTHALKVDFWDTDEMTNKIVSVLRYGSLQHTLREHGRRELNSITWDRSAHTLLDVYNHL